MADRKTNLTNAFETTLSSEMTSVAGSMNLQDVTGLVHPFYVVIEPDSVTQREYVYVSNLSGNTATVSERYLAGSAAPSGLTHPAGSVVRMAAVAQLFEDLNDRVDALDTQLGTFGDHGGLAGLADDDHGQYHTAARHAAVDHNALVDHGLIAGLADDDHTQYFNVARHDADDHSALVDRVEIGEVGELTVKTGTFRWYAPYNLTIVRATASLGVAATGSQVEFDVNKNGVTIFTTQSNRPIIPAGQFFDASGTPNVTSMTKDVDYLTFDIDAIGSTLPGEDATLVVEFVRA